MRVNFIGRLHASVTAKDMILHLIATHSAAGGAGYAVEFAGLAIRDLEVEARLTLCNMAVEFSAFTGIIAPDQKVVDYLQGRPYAPGGGAWHAALSYWQALRSDDDAKFDREINIDCSDIAPTITWGTSPQHAIPIDGFVPSPDTAAVSETRRERGAGIGLHGSETRRGAGRTACASSVHRFLHQ